MAADKSAVSFEEYIRTDVFEANMKRIDDRFDSLEKRIDDRFDSLEKRMDERFEAVIQRMDQGFALMNERSEKNLAEIKGEIRALDARVDALYTWQYWQIAWIGILVAGAALIPALMQYLSSRIKTHQEPRSKVHLIQAAEASEETAGNTDAPEGSHQSVAGAGGREV